MEKSQLDIDCDELLNTCSESSDNRMSSSRSLLVLDDVDSQSIDYLACLGDIVGYGGKPNECCDLIRERADAVVVGNHDAAMTGRMDYDLRYRHGFQLRQINFYQLFAVSGL